MLTIYIKVPSGPLSLFSRWNPPKEFPPQNGNPPLSALKLIKGGNPPGGLPPEQTQWSIRYTFAPMGSTVRVSNNFPEIHFKVP